MQRRTAPRAAAPSVSLSRLEAADRQNVVLLRAWQTAHPVLHEGQRRFIHTLTFQKPGGNPEVVVYLAGMQGTVPAEALTLDPHYLATQLDSSQASEAEHADTSEAHA
jgi:hypothetical protein